MTDRGIIKWRPFDSLYDTNKILYEINNKKEKVSYPTLSDDQLQLLEEKIKNSYLLKEKINLDYFYNGKIINICGIINYIFPKEKKIIINNKTIFFVQIININ